MTKIYVASSWRNTKQPGVILSLREAGHSVYDFRNPSHGLGGFHWSELDPEWQSWTPAGYKSALLSHPKAAQGFLTDLRAMMWSELCVMVMPCGRSAHLELGWCAGAGKRTIILLSDGEPELMNLLADDICLDIDEVIVALNGQSVR